MIINLYPAFQIVLLLFRILVAAIFISSGWSHVQHPNERGKDIGMSSGPTLILGWVEIIGSVSIAFGIWIQIGAALLILTMLGAIYKKIMIWNIGFYEDQSFGWHYDLLLLMANLIIITANQQLVLIG